jgi:RNA polymerase sigma factor (sigma-70 family)
MAVRERELAPDVEALPWLVPDLGERYHDTFDRLARRMRIRGLSAEDAADLAQEAIALTLSHIRRHGVTRADLKPLINTIAKNLVVERFRSGGRELAVPIDEWVLQDKQDVGEEVASRDRANKIHAAINEIPERQRTAVLMSMEGVGPSDIAKRLGIKRNAVDALLHRARRQLATRLQDCRDAVWGSSAFVWLRIRGRNLGWVLGSSGSAFPGIAPNLLALSAVFMLSIMPTITPAGEDRARSDRSGSRESQLQPFVANGSTDVVEHSRVPSRAGGPSTSTGDEPALRIGRRPRAGVVTETKNPTTGEDDKIGFRIRHDPDDDNGWLTPWLNRGFDLACDTVPSACEEE